MVDGQANGQAGGEPTPPDAAGLLAFLHGVGNLKRLRRQGWVDRDVADPESVADHSFRLAMLAWLTAERNGLDANRAVRLALVHDLPESFAGDLTPFGDLSGLSREERARRLRESPTRTTDEQSTWDARKHALEAEGLARLLSGLREVERHALTDLWLDYERGQSAEARLVKQLDKLETWIQAREYLADDPNVAIDSFRVQIERLELPQLLRALADLAAGESGGR